MTKLIVGSYSSKEEAIKAINIFELSGHEAKNIVVLTDKEQAKILDKQRNLNVKTDSPEENQKASSSFTEKVRSLFSQEDDLELDTVEKIVDFGLSLEEAEQCMQEVKAGKIVVIADDELRMGHA